MDLLSINFRVLQFCGAWSEHKDSSLITWFFRVCYRYSIALLIHYFTIFEIIEIVRTRNDIEDFTEGLCFALTFTTMCIKYINFLLRECEVRNLLDCYRNKLCLPRNFAEESILRRYDYKAKLIIYFFMFISQVTGIAMLISPLLTLNKRRLPCKMYVPYSISALRPYILTYLQQATTIIYGILLNVSFDSLVYGFILQTCGQIELLCYRFKEAFKFLQENNKEQTDAVKNMVIAECVEHHISVYNITHKIQSLFMWTITALFFSSLVTLCTSIYQMSKKDLFGTEFFYFITYLGAMLFQAFSYCWYGNELDLKNKNIAQAIYSSNWMALSFQQRKSLLFVIMMSQRGKIICFYGIFALTLNTFTWIIKTSYSAFNLLQQASD